VTHGLKDAVVLVLLTQQPRRPRGTRAGKVVDKVVARAAISARLVSAVVNVKFTVQTLVARGTGAPTKKIT
jgi:hypothetical protein